MELSIIHNNHLSSSKMLFAIATCLVHNPHAFPKSIVLGRKTAIKPN